MKSAFLVHMPESKPLSIYRALLKHYGPQDWWPAETPFEVVVGAVLTQRTSWKNVELAIENLKRAGLMDLEALTGSDPELIQENVRPSGFYRVKAQRVMNLARHLKACGGLDEFFSRDMSSLRKELLALEGIGKETADSILLYAGSKPIFVVDAYTLRLCERLGLPIKKPSYDEIQAYFQAAIPKDVKLYREFHALIVIHGKERCRTKPICKNCPLQKKCEFQK